MVTKDFRISCLCAALAVWSIICVSFTPAAFADQTDPALDDLFATLQSTKNPAEAAAADQSIWEVWTVSGDPTVDRLMQTGLLAMHAGELETAEVLFTEITQLRPDFAEGWNKRATVRYMRGDFTGSIADCGQTLALEDRHYGALSGMGLIHQAQGDAETALDWFERALSVNPHMSGVKEHISALQRELRGRAI